MVLKQESVQTMMKRGLGRKHRGLKFKGLKRYVAMLCLLTGVSVNAMANSAAEMFEQFVQTFSAATGVFEQSVLDDKGQASQMQSGEFSFQRPGKFRWSVLKPHEQLIISDGRVVQQYDPDLRQTTIRQVDAAMGSSPAALLFGEKPLQEAFQLSSLPDEGGMIWLRATPFKADSGLNRVDIGMKEGIPAQLLIQDGFGQTTRIELSRIRAQSEFPAGTFVFKSPAGTDVIEMP